MAEVRARGMRAAALRLDAGDVARALGFYSPEAALWMERAERVGFDLFKKNGRSNHPRKEGGVASLMRGAQESSKERERGKTHGLPSRLLGLAFC